LQTEKPDVDPRHLDNNHAYISDLEVDQELNCFYMVKQSAVRTGSNGKLYFNLTLGDCTGEVRGNKWDVQETDIPSLEQIQAGKMVRIIARVTEYQKSKQLRITRIRLAQDQDQLEMERYIKCAPEKSEDMYDYIHSVAKSMTDPDLNKLSIRVLEDHKKELMYYPAASRNHHAEYGGLLYHMKRMLMHGIKVCEVYTDLNRDLLATGVIVHDIMKIREIESNEYGISPGYSMEGEMLGHLVMGVKYLDRLAEELGFPEEKRIMVEHMVLSHHYEPEFGSPKRPMFPEAEVLHYLDIMDARIYDMYEALSSVDPGKFSDKVWTLENRKIYRPKG
jgi:3'-5' exoribonuclease